MTRRLNSATNSTLLLLFAVLGAAQRGSAQSRQEPPPTFPALLQKLASAAPNPCDTPGIADDSESIEYSVFGSVEKVVIDALNLPADRPMPAFNVVDEALRRLERQSAEIDAAWPVDNRLHHQLIDLAPLLVLKLTFRTHARFFVFGRGAKASQQPWRTVGSDGLFARDWPQSSLSLEIRPLHRSPSGNPRFPASFDILGCAGNTFAVRYDAREWVAGNGTGDLEQMVRQDGFFGLDQTPVTPTRENPFPSIGNLSTNGRLMSLPYCWLSAIDTWDNPSLCAVDVYDLSGDAVTFVSRTYNRPDLVPISKVVEFADAHDYPALRAYCGSDRLARAMLHNAPPHAEGDIQITRIGAAKERVDVGSGQYEVERRNGRWLVFSVKSN